VLPYFHPAAFLLLAAFPVIALSGESVWRSGIDMRRTFDSEVGVTWQEAPLRTSLANLANGQSFAILLDRRVDPDRKLTFNCQSERLEVLMLRLAEREKLGFSAVANVLYLGPPATASKLATMAALRRAEGFQATNIAARLATKKEVRWPMLAQPRDLVTEAATAYGLKVVNPADVPHDLWPAASWPAMGCADRLTLLLAGFDMTFELDPQKQQIRLLPMPPITTMDVVHTHRGEMPKAVAEIKKLFPDVTLQAEGTQLHVSAAYETQEKISRLLSGEQVRTTKVAPGQQRYSMTVEKQPAGAVVASVAKGLGKEAKFTAEIRTKLAQLVSFQVKDVTHDELLKKALEPLGLRAIVTAAAIEVVPAE